MHNTFLLSSFLKYFQFPIVVNRRPIKSGVTHLQFPNEHTWINIETRGSLIVTAPSGLGASVSALNSTDRQTGNRLETRTLTGSDFEINYSDVQIYNQRVCCIMCGLPERTTGIVPRADKM